MKKTILSILSILALSSIVNAQNVTIPDANFKSAVVGDPTINTNGDAEIQITEAVAFTGTLFLGSINLSDATGIEAFINATGLQIQGNPNLTSLDLSSNTELQNISCNVTGITSLNLGFNSELIDLYANNTNLTSLDVGYASNLEKLIVSDIPTLTSIDLTSNFNLDEFDCSGSILIGGAGSVKEIDFSQNYSLISLKVDNAGLTSLDVSNLSSLVNVKCNDNNLEYLNVANMNNANMGNFSNIALDARNNPNLTCIQIDNGFTPSTPNWEKDAMANYSISCPTSCTVNIPDANFKNYLVGNASINTNGDTEIQCSEASAFSGGIFCNGLSISDLTGIEEFTSLVGLNCSDNLLTNVDVSSNIMLQGLQCHENQLTSLSTNNNTQLSLLRCHTNMITNLDLSSNTNLSDVYAYDNQLTGLTLPQSNLMEELELGNNQLSTIDVSSFTNLTRLNLDYNQLSAIDISQNTLLEDLYLRDNLFTSLDCSNNTVLNWIVVNNNSNIEWIDVSNGNNNNFGFFWAHNSPNLTCIKVDDVNYSNTNWTSSSFNFDAQSIFNTNCNSAVLVSSINVQGQGGANTITIDDGTLQMEATVLPANADDDTYTWSVVNGTGTASIDVNGLLTALTNGTVDVVATANDGSGTTGMTTITISNQTVGINENQLVQFNIYPNPVQNELFIELNENQITQINIIDLAGKVLLSQKQINGNSINVSSLAQGVYTIQISTEKGMATSRFVKK